MRTDTTTLYRQAIEIYGIDAQLNQLQEECAELIVAVNKHRKTPFDDFKGLIDEFTDVEIMIEQMKQFFNVEQQVQERKEFKLNRLQNRLNETL